VTLFFCLVGWEGYLCHYHSLVACNVCRVFTHSNGQRSVRTWVGGGDPAVKEPTHMHTHTQSFQLQQNGRERETEGEKRGRAQMVKFCLLDGWMEGEQCRIVSVDPE
jgi:hypothetical protein